MEISSSDCEEAIIVFRIKNGQEWNLRYNHMLIDDEDIMK